MTTRGLRLPASCLLAMGAWMLVASAARAQDAPAGDAAKTTGDASAETTSTPIEPATLELLDDLDAARKRAREQGKPLLLIAFAGWFEDPAEKQLRDEVLAGAAARESLAGFVTVVVEESVDREVHRRHRLKDRGYPLAVLLSARGEYLGSVAGLPTQDAATAWPRDVAAIPKRHARAAELLDVLAKSPEDPEALFELARVYLQSGEPERADALLERFERADALDATGHLGEARYQRLRMAAAARLAARDFVGVQPPCLKWLRRFDAEHPRRPAVLLQLANARYLGGDAEGAKKAWQRIVDEHAESDAAKTARRALAEL